MSIAMVSVKQVVHILPKKILEQKLKIYQQVKLPTHKFYGKHYNGRV